MITEQRKTALYVCLSSDDGGVNESDSIVHQRQILTNYAHEHEFANITEFVDDGYSRANFTNRPQFQDMIHMVENGEIGIVVVKDLSRLGIFNDEADHLLFRSTHNLY